MERSVEQPEYGLYNRRQDPRRMEDELLERLAVARQRATEEFEPATEYEVIEGG